MLSKLVKSHALTTLSLSLYSRKCSPGCLAFPMVLYHGDCVQYYMKAQKVSLWGNESLEFFI